MHNNDESFTIQSSKQFLLKFNVRAHGGRTPKPMSVTIRDIAEAANVSRGTVDRALHNRPGVSAEAAKKIMDIARKMNYEPDMPARVLANKRYKRKIGILLCSLGNPFFDDVIRGIEDALNEAEPLGIQGVIKKIKGFHIQQQLEAIDELMKEQISGLVITPVNAPEIARRIRELEEQNIPVATINTDIASDVKHFLYVGCNYEKSGNAAGGFLGLVCNGHREHMAIVTGSRMAMAQEERLEGIRSILKQEYPNITVDAVLENEDDDQTSYEIVKKFLEGNQEITTICFISAGVRGGLQAIKETEKKLRIVTYDLTDAVRESMKAGDVLATICQEPYQQGYLGVNMLARYLAYQTRPENQTIETQTFVLTKYNL